MDNQQRAKLDANNRVMDFIIKHQTDMNTISEFQAEQQKFATALQAIKDAGNVQEQIGIDQSISSAAKQKMAEVIAKYCLRAGVKARSIGNIQLANELQTSASEIFNANKTKSLEIANNKRKSLFDNLNILSNINNSNISDIDNAINDYNSIKDAPIETRQFKKATGTDSLTPLFIAIDEAENNMRDLIISYFSDTQPKLVREFLNAQQVISTGIRSTSAIFSCIADETLKPITSFAVTDQATSKIYKSDENGLATIDHHKTGHFHFTITAPSRTDVDFASDIRRGTHNNFTVRLKN